MARAEWSISPMSFSSVPAGKSYAVHGVNKVTINSSRTLALGIAGLTQDHSYTQKIEHSKKSMSRYKRFESTSKVLCLSTIAAKLRKLSQFRANEGKAPH